MICLPICCIILNVSDNGRNPDRVEAQVLDVIDPIDDAPPRPATVLGGRRVAFRARVVRSCESVGKYLVDSPGAPFVRGRRKRGQDVEREEEKT